MLLLQFWWIWKFGAGICPSSRLDDGVPRAHVLARPRELVEHLAGSSGGGSGAPHRYAHALLPLFACLGSDSVPACACACACRLRTPWAGSGPELHQSRLGPTRLQSFHTLTASFFTPHRDSKCICWRDGVCVCTLVYCISAQFSAVCVCACGRWSGHPDVFSCIVVGLWKPFSPTFWGKPVRFWSSAVSPVLHYFMFCVKGLTRSLSFIINGSLKIRAGWQCF